MAITGDGAGNTEGMGWNSGQLFGRWEVCAKSTPASPNYHSVLLLWPDSERWPADGEIDFMEIFDPQRQNVTASVLHVWPEDAGAVDHNYHTSIPIDATGWHSWAVEWTRDLVIGYVDGNEWFRVGQHVPRTSMHLCIQLDNFGGDVSEGGQLAVDWAHQYPLH
jgi:licheninase